ncbi:MAG: MiaB/RimO family radical SAM methylthiotransferase, partial [Candidatus Omnitrophota bacterium]|nr:MiaB/RimO family radical SAM methylthiotransferase [Candidatus Omnitrophota bacterium]
LPKGERGLLAVDRESRLEIKNIAYHKKGVSALVTIMEGCNNFCSYCIVPYVRGREVGRPVNSIIDEITALAENGYKEVTLLGQNVNSYKQVSPHPCPLPGEERGEFGKANFIELLEQINGIKGIERIRFLTSHPKDAGEDLFKAIRDLDKVCEHLHLPLQSGSDRILKSMNRGYTASEYARKAELLKKYVPDCAMTTDIIVGYPGETEEDFKATKKLMEEIEFNSAFIFKYSPRPPAKASGLDDDVPKGVKEERNQALLQLRDRISGLKDKEFIGTQAEVLVENICRKEKHKVTGRNRQNLKVALTGKSDLIGKLKMVKINSIFGHTLVGSLVALTVLFGPVFFNEANAQTPEEYFVRGDYENAAREATKTLSSASKEKDKLYYISGTSLNKLGRYELARENFKSLIENYSKSEYAPLAQLGLADSYYLSADYQNAAEAYEKYITGYPKSEAAATAYFRLGKCAQKEGKWQSARNYYQKVKAEYPLSFEAQMASRALSEEMLYFTVQVGSFGKKSNALKLCDELVKKGYDASILKMQSDGQEAYRVRVGRLDTRAEAEELARRLQAEGLPIKILP